MFDKSGKIIKKFDCVKQCVNEYPELSASQINRVLNKTIKSHKGYTFKYQDDDIVWQILKDDIIDIIPYGEKLLVQEEQRGQEYLGKKYILRKE